MPGVGSSEWGANEWGDDGSLWTPVVTASVGWAPAAGVASPADLSEWMSEWGSYEWGSGATQTGPWTLVQPGTSLWSKQ